MSLCTHAEMLDNICLICEREVLLFTEEVDFYVRDLCKDKSLNNFNYLTNLLPLEFHEYLTLIKPANQKMLKRFILKTLPVDMIYKYILPKINWVGYTMLCKEDGKLYKNTKTHLHAKCQPHLQFQLPAYLVRPKRALLS